MRHRRKQIPQVRTVEALDARLLLSATSGTPEPLDVDANCDMSAFRDAALLFAWMSEGTPDSTLERFIANDAGSSRDVPDKVRNHLNAVNGSANNLDVDGDGVIRPFRDGVLVFAWMTDGTPDSVFTRFAGQQGSRGTAAEVTAWLNTINTVDDGERTLEQEAGTPTISGASLDFLPNSGSDPAVGEFAPEFTGQDYNNATVNVQNDGRAKAIVFAAHWCPHCQEEIPAVQNWLNQTGGVDGVDIYTVVTSMDPTRDNWAPSEWLASEGWTPPVVRDSVNSELSSAFGLTGFPYWVFINSDGRVAQREVGNVSINNLESIMQSLQ